MNQRLEAPDSSPGGDEAAVFFVEIGGERRAYDPFRIERLLARGLEGEPLAEVLRSARGSVSALAAPSMEKLLSATCLAFDLTPIQPDGTGATEKVQLRVLTEFLRWRAAVKKNAESSPTSSAPTAAVSSAAN
jgi:hypothetical protein